MHSQHGYTNGPLSGCVRHVIQQHTGPSRPLCLMTQVEAVEICKARLDLSLSNAQLHISCQSCVCAGPPTARQADTCQLQCQSSSTNTQNGHSSLRRISSRCPQVCTHPGT